MSTSVIFSQNVYILKLNLLELRRGCTKWINLKDGGVLKVRIPQGRLTPFTVKVGDVKYQIRPHLLLSDNYSIDGLDIVFTYNRRNQSSVVQIPIPMTNETWHLRGNEDLVEVPSKGLVDSDGHVGNFIVQVRLGLVRMTEEQYNKGMNVTIHYRQYDPQTDKQVDRTALCYIQGNTQLSVIKYSIPNAGYIDLVIVKKANLQRRLDFMKENIDRAKGVLDRYNSWLKTHKIEPGVNHTEQVLSEPPCYLNAEDVKARDQFLQLIEQEKTYSVIKNQVKDRKKVLLKNKTDPRVKEMLDKVKKFEKDGLIEESGIMSVLCDDLKMN